MDELPPSALYGERPKRVVWTTGRQYPLNVVQESVRDVLLAHAEELDVDLADRIWGIILQEIMEEAADRLGFTCWEV